MRRRNLAERRRCESGARPRLPRAVWWWSIPANLLIIAAILVAPWSTAANAAPTNYPGQQGSAADLYSRVGWDKSGNAVGMNGNVLVGTNNTGVNGVTLYGSYISPTSYFLMIVAGGPYDGDCVFFGFGHYYVKGCVFQNGLAVPSEVWNSTSTNYWSQLQNLYQGTGISIVWAGAGNQITYGPANGTADNTHWHFNCGLAC